jgi:type IV secretion system protein VirB4
MFNRFRTKHSAVQNREVGASSFIPYLCHFNESTILTKKNDLVSFIRIEGFPFEAADDAEIDSKKEIRNNVFKAMTGGNFSIYIHTIRKKHASYPNGEFENDFANALNKQWKAKNAPEYVFLNEHYISIVRKNSSIANMMSNIAAQLNKDEDNSDTNQALIDAYNELAENVEKVLQSFNGYNAKLLEVKKEGDAYYCEMLEFTGMLTNGLQKQKYLVPKTTIDRYFQTTRIYTSRKAIECHSYDETKYMGIVSLKNYRPSTHAGLLDTFLTLPFELVITQSFSYMDKSSAISKMQLQQRRLMQAEDPSISQVAEITRALDQAMAGRYAFGLHHLSILCIAESKKALDKYCSNAAVELTNIGIINVRETINMEACFWGQLPGNESWLIRKATINTLNLAGFASMHNFPQGKIDGNHWGDAVTVFNTVSGTPFFFNFHVRDVGHTMIIGPTGAGKTVLMNFLCAQAQKFRPRMFFFDKDHGAEIFIRALGGHYAVLDPSEKSSFNPLHLEENHNNKAFLFEWFSNLILGSETRQLTPEESATIAQAVDGIYRLPREQRVLRNVASFFGTEFVGSIASKLTKWHSNGEKSNIFDNANDKIDFSTGNVFGFEMGPILQDSVALAPTLNYLFHRIQTSLDGTPTIIILDEAWALIDNPVFAPKIKDWLKVMRKLNAMVVFATQSVEDATKSSISDTLVQQTATQIFLPNLRATESYQKMFMLSDKEFDIVKNTDPSSRFFIVKQDTHTAIARIDLSGMSDAIHILSGRAETVELLNSIRQDVGDEPEDWIPIFLAKVYKL